RRVTDAPLAPALVAEHGAQWLPAVDDRHEVPGVDPWGAPASGDGPVPIPGTDLAFGHRQELSIDGLVWLRARAYDPATRGFLSPDPLPPVRGVPWTHNTYQYAANDPVNHLDPLGLQALSDQALNDIRNHMKKGWWEKHWKVVAAIGVIAVGVVLTVIPVTGPAGVALMLAGGALIGGGASYAIQMGTTGEVSWKQVFIDAGIGMVSAGVSGLATKGLAQVGTKLTAPTRVAAVGASEGTINVGAGMVQRWATGQPVFDPKMIALDATIGSVLGSGVAGGVEWRASVKANRAAAAADGGATPGVQDVDVPTTTVDAPGVDTTVDLPDGAVPTGATPNEGGTVNPANLRDPGTGTASPDGTGSTLGPDGTGSTLGPDGTSAPETAPGEPATRTASAATGEPVSTTTANATEPATTTTSAAGEPAATAAGEPTTTAATGAAEPATTATSSPGDPTATTTATGDPAGTTTTTGGTGEPSTRTTNGTGEPSTTTTGGGEPSTTTTGGGEPSTRTTSGTGEPAADPVVPPAGGLDPQPLAARGTPADPTVVRPGEPRVDAPATPAGTPEPRFEPIHLGDRVPVRGADDAAVPVSPGTAD
ncbi:MAG TPA: RHS repeat-associated core domain-containing protein, partial [Acidimicrobiales bacterium]